MKRRLIINAREDGINTNKLTKIWDIINKIPKSKRNINLLLNHFKKDNDLIYYLNDYGGLGIFGEPKQADDITYYSGDSIISGRRRGDDTPNILNRETIPKIKF